MKEIGMVVSCGDSAGKGWRTELDLGSGKSLDDHHAAATFGTEPKWARFLAAHGPNVVDVHRTYVKLQLDNVLYTVAFPARAAELAPGSYKAKWEDGKRRLKVLWNDGQKDRTVDCRVVAMDTPKPE